MSFAPPATAAPVLVTGASGFVGGHLLQLLSTASQPIVGWNRPGTPRPAIACAEWMEVEMLDRAGVAEALARIQPSAVYHLAGSAHVADSWHHTRETFAGNVLATHHLLQGLRAGGLSPRVLITGSATIYKPADVPLTESSPLGPNSPYATSKLAQEMLACAAWEEHGLPVLLARSFNHVGPGQTPAYVAPSIARQVALIEAGQMEPVLTLGNLTPQRDVMDVRDTVRAYRAMMATARPGVPYNVCSGRAVAIGALVDLFLTRAQKAIRIDQDPSRMRPNDVPLLVGDHSRLTADTGWEPAIPLSQTVDDLLAYWRGAI